MRPGNTGYSGQKSVGISCDGIQQKKGGLNRVITTVIALAASGVQAEYRGPDGSDQWQPRGPGNEAVQVRVDTSCLPNFVTPKDNNGRTPLSWAIANSRELVIE